MNALDNAFINAVLRAWEDQRGYALRLVADLGDDDFVSQPVEDVVMNHPAWVLSHLGAYAPILTAILREADFEDPASHRYGRSSAPVADPSESPPRDELIARYTGAYDETAAALRAAPGALLAAPTPLERWIPRFPTIADVCVQLLVKHQATHLGQLSAWRRAGGRPPV